MKRLYFILLCSSLYTFAVAQKLPDLQETSMAAPKAIKIDGKSTEWNNQFAAYNRRTDLQYALANDANHLYLIINASNSATISKILLGGITFSVNHEGQKREKESVAITYPLIARPGRNAGNRIAAGQGRRAGQQGFPNRADQTTFQRDSILLISRKAQLASAKEIKVAGIQTIPDSLISIYNEYGIKAVGGLSAAGNFVYELGIPLGMLNLIEGKEFAYQIKLNGSGNLIFGGDNRGGGDFGGRSSSSAGRGANGGESSPDLNSPTNFWGKYLIKK